MDAEEICRNVYAETRAFYDRADGQFRRLSPGFRVLYGPPLVGSPLLFLGYQPGGDQKDAEAGLVAGEHDSWPNVCDYAIADWKLAKALRAIWDKDVLQRSTGLNAIFFRAKTVAAWHALEPTVRKEAEDFCRPRAERIVRSLEPQRIVVIGTQTFDRLADKDATIALASRGRTLVKSGQIWGSPAVGVIHLSGARIGAIDRSKITEYLTSLRLSP